ncbi:hemolysin family protein [Pseudanabaena sp. PCC 6802]|uniref:hemolysin family protein n=1 Tax=Pseudanabaena sp. PCC 6802 TaxID=118173 RepID=UPI00034C471D|nr:hemolysin family protein [Pseudanabaena sp. PCC 6802]
MNILNQLIVIAFLIGINAFFAAAEIALVSVSDVRIKTLADRGNKQAKRVLQVTEDSTKFLATIQVGLTLASFFTSATAASELSEPLELAIAPVLGKSAKPMAFIGITIAIATISLILGELVPKKLALRHAEAISLFAISPIHWLGKIAAPFVKFLSVTTNFILFLTGNPASEDDPAINVEEIKAMVDAARIGGTVGEQERRIIYGAVELSHITTRAIMVPRVQIQYIKASTTLEEAYKIAADNAHTRLPVCNEDLDNIIGILHVKDLIRPVSELIGSQPAIAELIRPVRYVSENYPATALLREMQKNRLHIAIVQDEFGGTAGLVTIEDVLEEIVGEIRDEYDAEEEKEFRRISDREGIFKIRASIATVNNELNAQLPRDEAATLAGLFLEELQRSPIAGDRLEIDRAELVVLEDGQRVRVAITPQRAQPGAETI